MPSIISGYEYDIFISYRQKDNRSDQWVTNFVQALREEMDATFKEDISIYFDKNPHDGLGETHDVDDSLAKKLKCLIFIPIISKTYCDPNSFAWTNEFLTFNKLANSDEHGLKVNLPNGNTASRVLPVRIHDIDDADKKLVEDEIGFLRSIDFVYQSVGVNRPLRAREDDPTANLNKTFYRDQINKVANAIQEIVTGIKTAGSTEESDSEGTEKPQPKKIRLSSEIKRRNVLRTSLVYILTSLFLWKVTDISIGMFSLPSGTLNFVTLLLIVLFPISILMAWLYERSPKGFVRTGSTASRENPFTTPQKKPLTSFTFILLLVVTIGALFIIFPKSILNAPNNSNTTITSDNKSIAVLYFDNMSGDPEQEYFSDGMTEEIIAQIAKIKDLRVISRNSVKVYKGQALNVKKIAAELDVSAILEGSVRKSGNRIRITAQLIDASNDEIIWSDIFERELTDIFQIQTEIALKIANKFEIDVTSEEQKTLIETPETNLTAYELYLKARQKLAMRGEALVEARQLFNRVIQLDPNYSPAYSGLARTLSLVPFFVNDFKFTDTGDVISLIKDAAKQALELDPKNAEAYSVLGSTAAFFEWNWEIADQALKKSIELNPNDSELYNFIGDYYTIVSHPILSIKMKEKALTLDPLFPINHGNLSMAYFLIGDYENALRYAKSGLELENEQNTRAVGAAYCLVRSYIELDRIEDAEAAINEYAERGRINLSRFLVYLYLGKGQIALARSSMEQYLKEKGGLQSFGLPWGITNLLIDLEMYEEAATKIEKEYHEKAPGLVYFSLIKLPEHLPNNPKVQAALDKPELNALFEIRRRNLKLKESDSQ